MGLICWYYLDLDYSFKTDAVDSREMTGLHD